MKRLVRNIGIFAIGNLGSKVIGFLLIAIFTRYLTTTQFGYVDLITTTVNMLLPIIALSIADAVFRFVMDDDANDQMIFSTGVSFTLLMSLIVFLIAFPILKLFDVHYAGLVLLYLAASLVQILFQNFVRGIGYVRLFAINGLVSALVLAGCGIWQVVYLRNGITGYLNALIIATIFSVLFIGFIAKLWTFFRISANNRQLLKAMLQYSIPLIPNAFLWFFTNDASRYFIVGFVGLAVNGLYAVATKLPTIINVFYTIFSQAWQISAVEEYRKNRHSRFFSDVFSADVGLSVILIGAILIILRPIMTIFVASEYFDAWKIVPALLLASFFSNLASFLGTIYLATKETKGIMMTTVYGMIVNLLLNVILIPLFGIQGAGIGAAIGFAFVMYIRLRDIRKFVDLHVNWRQLWFSLLILFSIVWMQFIFTMGSPFLYVLVVSLESILVWINRKALKKIN
ncbi:glycosyl transferase [Lactiplantibacillus plantarum]|nr:polysaccharide biosynthesis C-terminal domain-containing protein [Lactiplantibacillus plantarum]ARK35729.1 glycosyl transferase [Lactiplantibacillus plantarum]QAR77458.1 glycosyl transferase [Lactiplantibacillus plantarum]QAS31269.1 glycosyl transferase [Lactiplantibacillus plantarum]QBA78747.1 glycosyl transferase [Lactiplantibacillus plantarum]RWZ49461.1 glycosyl transferase [Lactiplantibacillus plantarum]